MCKGVFLDKCREFCDSGYHFVALQRWGDSVTYSFSKDGVILELTQSVDKGRLHSISSLFPLADFAERQLYRDFEIKAIGNMNLVPGEEG